MYLFFDTETTGLENPQLVQLAYILSDAGGRIIEQNDFIVKPYGFEIPAESVKFHGITTKIATEKGVLISEALENFKRILTKSEYVVGHNVAYDVRLMNLAFEKFEYHQMFQNKKLVCTSNDIKPTSMFPNFWKKISNRQTLSSLYFNLFKEKLENAHTASADTVALFKCFWILKSKNLILCK
jgi:DNA polymerase III epsilon subunit-like protein